MNVWEIAILKSVAFKGGRATTGEIYDVLESGRFITLNDTHLTETKYQGRPAYRHQVRSHLCNLKQAGDLTNESRGLYSLTERGRSRIKNG